MFKYEFSFPACKVSWTSDNSRIKDCCGLQFLCNKNWSILGFNYAALGNSATRCQSITYPIVRVPRTFTEYGCVYLCIIIFFLTNYGLLDKLNTIAEIRGWSKEGPWAKCPQNLVRAYKMLKHLGPWKCWLISGPDVYKILAKTNLALKKIKGPSFSIPRAHMALKNFGWCWHLTENEEMHYG